MNPTPSNVAGYYNTRNIQTASAARKVVMLHDRVVELLRLSRTAETAQRRLNLDKAQNILSQLQTVLRVEDEVSQGLFYLYDYTYVLLERGDIADVTNSLALFVPLRDTFRELLHAAG